MTARRISFVLFSLVVSPLVGLTAAYLIDSHPFTWIALFGLPAALTYTAGAALGIHDGISTVFALLSPAVVVVVGFALLIYAASQGAFE